VKKLIVIFVIFMSAMIKAEIPGNFGTTDTEQPAVDIGAVLVEEDEAGQTTGLNDLSQSTDIIKGRAISASPAVTVADILDGIPGIYMNKSDVMSFGTGRFAPSVMTIRGLGGAPNSGILTVIDGRPQAMGIYRHPLFDTLMLGSVESIEIIKGPSGVLYGNQAVAGVINITTKKREVEGANYSVGSMIGNDFTQDHFFSALVKKEELDLNASAEYSSTAGSRPNSDSYLENGHAHAGYEIEKNLNAAVNVDYAAVRAFNPGPAGVIWPREAEASKLIQRDGDFRIEYKMNDYSGSTMFFTDSGSNKFLMNAMPVTFTPSGFVFVPGSYSQYENDGMRIANEWVIFPGNSTKAGFDWQYFGGYFSSTMKDKTWHENDYAPYFSVSQAIGIFGLSAGLRYDINSEWGSVPIPQAGFKISLFDQHTIYVNVSKGFKTPAMGVWVVTPYDELNPEEFWEYEIGTNHTIFENITYNVALFQTEGKNLMQTDPVDGMLKNSGFIILRGVEADISGKFMGIFTAGAGATYVDPREKTADTAYLSGSAYIKSDVTKTLSLKLSADFAKDRFGGNYRSLKLADYTTLSLSGDYRVEVLGTETTVYLTVDNMLDDKYDVKPGYPAPGFMIKGGAVINF
jgi:iron complex outermembrane recepter protein